MRVLILNQAFHPDVVATAQHASDLAVALTQAGHEVYVVSGGRGYDDPSREFDPQEVWNGIQIFRVKTLGLGKTSKLARAINFASFLASCCFRLTTVPKCDVIIALTSPPLISYLACWLKRLTGAKLLYWTMDLNPDEAIAAGWLKENSLTAQILTAAHRFSIKESDQIVVLDRFMKERVASIGEAESRIAVVPPWSHDDVTFDLRERQEFRAANNLEGKFVVMYSGNHSPCHSLETALGAAKALGSNNGIQFLFVGGGSQFPLVQSFVQREGLKNVTCLPYQPKEKLSGSLSAADLHLVVMGNQFVGIVHPCKIYNILSIGLPFLYIGPSRSHVADLVEQLGASANCVGSFRHGDISGVVSGISTAANGMTSKSGSRSQAQFGASRLIPIIVSRIEALHVSRNAAPTPSSTLY